MAQEGISVLFVCLGNICRSPMAQGVFQSVIEAKGLRSRFKEIDSCGTGAYHLGEDPDPRALQMLRKSNCRLSHKARQLEWEDFERFDYILSMDESNLEDVKEIQAGLRTPGKARVMLFGDFGETKGSELQDPYYGGKRGFEKVYQQCVEYTDGFIRQVIKS